MGRYRDLETKITCQKVELEQKQALIDELVEALEAWITWYEIHSTGENRDRAHGMTNIVLRKAKASSERKGGEYAN